MKKRNTLQKSIVLQALKELHGTHPTPAQLYDYIHDRYPTISQATVFRILSSEVDEGEAQRVYAPDSSLRYEYGTRKHYHVSCKVCGQVEDVEMEYLDGLEKEAEGINGFKVEKHIVEFIGICPKCAEISDNI
jgi:Fe2+ or Zn2+ uptake regulation protein